MQISEAGIDLIVKFEGCQLHSYQDQRGRWTIGIGHTGADVAQGMMITHDRALELLREDAKVAEDAVNRWTNQPLLQGQFDALVSFCYNVGQGNFAGSNLLKLVNYGRSSLAAAEFLKWDHVAGKESAGLFARRTAEAAMFAGKTT